MLLSLSFHAPAPAQQYFFCFGIPPRAPVQVEEQLDSVASFVAVRRFPSSLGRRIRRHFRQFYKIKSAIDESKIFSEMSTSLRKEVSAYLIEELMGSGSFFMSMPPVLWPRLLPLLRPMRFEPGEIVQQQGEECVEVFVALTGRFLGATQVGPSSSTAEIVFGG